MSNCNLCPVEKLCCYEYKPCDCVQQRKFKPKSDRPKRDVTEDDVLDYRERLIAEWEIELLEARKDTQHINLRQTTER